MDHLVACVSVGYASMWRAHYVYYAAERRETRTQQREQLMEQWQCRDKCYSTGGSNISALEASRTVIVQPIKMKLHS